MKTPSSDQDVTEHDVQLNGDEFSSNNRLRFD